jgi:hypothetical protein
VCLRVSKKKKEKREINKILTDYIDEHAMNGVEETRDQNSTALQFRGEELYTVAEDDVHECIVLLNPHFKSTIKSGQIFDEEIRITFCSEQLT